MSTELLLLIVGLALLDTLSPAILGVTVYLLLSDTNRLLQRLLIYLATVAGFYFAVGLSLMLGLGVILEHIAGVFVNRIFSWSLFIIGGMLFTISFFIPTKKNAERSLPPSQNLLSMVVLGLTTSLVEVGTAFPYFTAIGLLTTAKLSWYEWISILGGYNFIMILPPLLLLLFNLLLGRWMLKPLQKLRHTINKHSGSALSWVLCIVGLLLIFNSLDYL